MKKILFKLFPFINFEKKISLTQEQQSKRNNLIQEIYTNAVAIKNNTVEIHKSCMEIEGLRDDINEILYFDAVDLDIFEKYADEFRSFPIGDERKRYNDSYLSKLDIELHLIDEKYKDLIHKKCDEIIQNYPFS